jgi:hypothetical protein
MFGIRIFKAISHLNPKCLPTGYQLQHGKRIGDLEEMLTPSTDGISIDCEQWKLNGFGDNPSLYAHIPGIHRYGIRR